MNGPFDCGLERKHIEPFPGLLSKHGLELTRGHTGTLQVSTGLLCNQACTHCHLEAGPGRKELMGPEIAEEVVGYARRGGFEVVDITGGAPELNPHIVKLLRDLSGFVPRLILRSNLTALNTVAHGSDLPALLKELRVAITASFPSTEVWELESQRGVGVLQSSIATLRRLNEMGYGHPASGLELNLIHNPPGPSLPAPQAVLEQRLRTKLRAKWKIEFNNLYTLANSPLGRFRKNLELAGKLDEYYSALARGFSPQNLSGVMCRTLVSVSWDGYLYDCDFNLAAGIPLGGRAVRVSEMERAPEPGSKIAFSDHCYACCAGAGFT